MNVPYHTGAGVLTLAAVVVAGAIMGGASPIGVVAFARSLLPAVVTLDLPSLAPVAQSIVAFVVLAVIYR